MAQETQTEALYQPRAVGWGGRWEFQKGGGICIPMADRFDRKQKNSVKQLSFNTHKLIKEQL